MFKLDVLFCNLETASVSSIYVLACSLLFLLFFSFCSHRGNGPVTYFLSFVLFEVIFQCLTIRSECFYRSGEVKMQKSYPGKTSKVETHLSEVKKMVVLHCKHKLYDCGGLLVD